MGGTSARRMVGTDQTLFQLDGQISADLNELDRQLQSANSSDQTLFLRTLLLHWTILLRRQSFRCFHTEVPGLDGDPECAGDLIADQVFLTYFDELVSSSTTRRAISALGAIARQAACLGLTSARSYMVGAFNHIETALWYSAWTGLTNSLVYGPLNPMPIVFDANKQEVDKSLIQEWLAQKMELITRGITAGRIPAVQDGLWLLDRRTDKLFCYRLSGHSADENDVDLPALF